MRFRQHRCRRECFGRLAKQIVPLDAYSAPDVVILLVTDDLYILQLVLSAFEKGYARDACS